LLRYLDRVHALAVIVAAVVWVIWPNHYVPYAILVALVFVRVESRRFGLGVLVDAYRARILDQLGEDALNQFKKHPTYYTRFWVARIHFSLVNVTAVVSFVASVAHLVRGIWFGGEWQVALLGLASWRCASPPPIGSFRS